MCGQPCIQCKVRVSMCFMCTSYYLFVCHCRERIQAGGVQEWDVEGGVVCQRGELTVDWRRLHGEKLHDFMLSLCVVLCYL